MPEPGTAARTPSAGGPDVAYPGDAAPRVPDTGHAFTQNLRRGHYELATDATARDRVAVAFTKLALAI